MLENLDHIDRTVFLFLNGLHSPTLDPIMWYISEPLTWLPLYLVLIYAAYKKHGLKGILWFLLGMGFVVLLADNIHRECFKEFFERLRPSRNPELSGLVHSVIKPKTGKPYIGGDYGFVSGHAANFTGITTLAISFLGLKNFWRWALVFWAGLICYSRIYLGVHYLGDILGGITLGLTIGFLTSFLVNKYLVKPKTT